MAFNKVFFHGIGNGIGKLVRDHDAAGIPVVAKSISNEGWALEVLGIKKASGLNHTIIYRDPAPAGANDDHPNYDMTPEDSARDHWERVKRALPQGIKDNRADVWVEPVNEIDTHTRSVWLGQFQYHIGLLALAEGYNLLLSGHNAGQPEPFMWERDFKDYLTLCAENPTRLGVSLHEGKLGDYNIPAWDETYYPWLIGRYQFLFDACDTMGIARPTTVISEWAWAYNGSPSQGVMMADVQWVAAEIAKYPNILGVCLWNADTVGSVAAFIPVLNEWSLTARFPDPPGPPPPPPPPPPEEHTHDDILQAIQDLRLRVGDLEQGWDGLELRFNDLIQRLQALGARLDQTNAEVSRIDDTLDNFVTDIDIDFTAIDSKLANLDERVILIEQKLAEKPPAPEPVGEGIDVSHHQGTINWFTAASQAGFAFIRASYGATVVDRMVGANGSGATANGVPFGYYHFYVEQHDPELQAKRFLAAVEASPRYSLPLVIDLESPPGFETGPVPRADLDYSMQLFINRVTNQMDPDVKPLIYTGTWYWKGHLGSPAWGSKYGLWIADWTKDRVNPVVPAPWTGWDFWQYTSSGSGPKYGAQSANIDLDRVYGSSLDPYDIPLAYNRFRKRVNIIPYITPESGNLSKVLVVANNWGEGDERTQLRREGNIVYIMKNSLYEKYAFDDQGIYLLKDTSPGNNQYYEVSNPYTGSRTHWLYAHMHPGEVCLTNHRVIFKDSGSNIVKAAYNSRSTMRFDNYFPKWTDPHSGKEFNDVIQISWISSVSAPHADEMHWFARGLGRIRWQKRDGSKFSYVKDILPA